MEMTVNKKIDKAVLRTIHKSGYSVLTNAKQFNTANTAYHANKDKRHDDINDSNCFIVYLDIRCLYPDRAEYIDGLDWTKIYLTIQPQPANPATATTTGVAAAGAGSDID